MTTEKMTVHKALAELKILNNRIDTSIFGGTYCIANKHSNKKVKGIDVEEYKKVIQGCYDKVKDLIDRNNAIKKAVTLSNARTMVTIDGKEYTVAEAIAMKDYGIEKKETFLEVLRDQYNKAQAEILKNNGPALDKRAEEYVIGLYGSKEGKTDTEDYEKTKKEFINTNQFELIDPIGILDKIENLEKEIDAFKADVDAVLSTSNAITEIEITY